MGKDQPLEKIKDILAVTRRTTRRKKSRRRNNATKTSWPAACRDVFRVALFFLRTAPNPQCNNTADTVLFNVSLWASRTNNFCFDPCFSSNGQLTAVWKRFSPP